VCEADAVLSCRRAATVLTAAALVAVSLSACSGSSDTGASAEEALADARTTLEDTSGVQLTLTTEDLPDGVTGVEKAEGVLTSAPAFDGTITVPLMGQAVEVPVIAVDGKVYAEVPFTSGWQDVDPAEYGAPDPARLMSADEGFASVLAATTDLEKGDSVRGGKDNSEVLTEYTGSVPGDVVSNVIPSASGDFDATYLITSDGELRSAELTGVFYEDSDPMTYAVTFEDYGTEKDITAP